MELSDALTSDRIGLNLSSAGKMSAIEEMIALMAPSMDFADPGAILQNVLDREAIQSTGQGRGIATPHGQSADIAIAAAALGISRSGLEFEGINGLPVHLIFLILERTSWIRRSPCWWR